MMCVCGGVGGPGWSQARAALGLGVGRTSLSMD